MARSITLASMKTQVRQRTNMESLVDPFVTEAELTGYINAGMCELYDKLVAAAGYEQYLQPYNMTTTPGVTNYSMPTAFYDLVGVDIQLGTLWLQLTRAEFAERGAYQLPVPLSGPRPFKYLVIGSTSVSFLPPPTGAYTVIVWYIPAPGTLSSDSDTFDGVAGWEEYIIAYASRLCLAKLKEDYTAQDEILAGMSRRIDAMAGMRDQGLPDKIVDMDVINEANTRAAYGWWYTY